MAQVKIKSSAITNAMATPRVQNAPGLENGVMVRAINALVTITSGDTQNTTYAAGASVYRLGKIRSSDYMHTWRIDTTADMGTTTVVDQDFIASSLSLKDGALSNTDLTFEAAAAGGLITNGEKRVWECLGLTTDPNKEYEVVMTLTGACDGTGTALVRVTVVR